MRDDVFFDSFLNVRREIPEKEVVEVKMEEVLKERMNMIEDSVRQTLRENKIRYMDLNADNNVVHVSIENLNSRAKALGLFRKLDKDYDVTETDGVLTIKYSDVALAKLKAQVVDQSIEIVRRRIDALGTKEPVIQRQGEDRIVVQLPGLQNPEEVKNW